MTCIFCGSRAHNYRACHMMKKPARQVLNFKQDYFGQAPNVFIGQYGYPRVRVGILGTEHYEKNDEPLTWSRENTSIPQIISLRSSLVNSFTSSNVKGAKLLDVTKEVSLAKRPVDVEVSMARKPKSRVTFSKGVKPHGPNVPLKEARVTENVKIDTRVDKTVSATDMKANEALTTLAKKGIDNYYLTKAFSLGNFGLPVERKLVPTRWSITAVDDTLGKKKIEEIRKYKESDCLAYFGGPYGNYYLILFFDDVWQYELFEKHLSSKQLWTDYEPYAGRKNYAKDTAGGYYAARIGIANQLSKLKRQSAVLALRFITDEYTAPLGVWVVREAVKKALNSEPIRFADRNLMLEYSKQFIMRKFSYDIKKLLSRSSLMKSIFGQTKLGDY